MRVRRSFGQAAHFLTILEGVRFARRIFVSADGLAERTKTVKIGGNLEIGKNHDTTRQNVLGIAALS